MNRLSPQSNYFTKAGNFLPAIGIPDKLLAVVLSVGQVMEILTMLILPWFYRRFGSKMTIGVGLAAWLIRYAGFRARDAEEPAPQTLDPKP
jgi:hypothetical protein